MNAEELEARRAAYVAGMRQLIEDMEDSLPDAEIHGIAGRVGTVLRAQLPALEGLAALDLTDVDYEAVLHTLVRAEHLPRMIVAFSKVLEEDAQKAPAERREEFRAWAPMRRRAIELARDLAFVVQAWVLAQDLGVDDLKLEAEEGSESGDDDQA